VQIPIFPNTASKAVKAKSFQNVFVPNCSRH